MENEGSNIDKLFQKKLSGFAPDTPEDLWPAVRISIEQGKNRRRILWMNRAGIAAAILLSFAVGYWFNDNNNQVPKQVVDQNAPTKIVEPGLEIEVRSNEAIAQEPIVGQKDYSEAEYASQIESSLNEATPSPEITEEKKMELYLSNSTNLSGKFDVSIDDMISTYRKEKGAILNFAASDANPREQSLALALTPDPDKNLAEQATHDEEKEAIKSQRKSGGFSIAAVAGPSIPIRKVAYREGETTQMDNLKNEALNNTYSAGMRVAYVTTNGWEIQTGAFINNWQQRSENIVLTSTGSVGSSTGTANLTGFTSTGEVEFTNEFTSIGNNPQQTYTLIPELHENYQYLDIPVNFGYYLFNGKWRLKLLAGVNTRILSGSTVELIHPDGVRQDYDGLNSVKTSWQLTAGSTLGYRFTKRFTLIVEPQLLLGISPIDRIEAIDTYRHQLMILSGLSYKL